ncbi:MAG: HAMP domain-containing sensor histidine kinase, partial [Pricia sp.]
LYLDSGLCEFSGNFYALLGWKKSIGKWDLDVLVQKIHPEDRDAFLQKLDLARTEGIWEENILRVVTQTLKATFLKNKGRVLGRKGDRRIIGTVQDITSIKTQENDMILKQSHLEEANERLERFNSVAAHDLKAPLRKMRLFISRVAETGSSRLEPRDSEYLEKVKKSAEHMQSLIDHLLTYSSTGESLVGKETIDLNMLLSEVCDFSLYGIELSEKKPSIIVDRSLPSVLAVRYQIERLFTNLISNSLKYAKPDVPTEIHISVRAVSNNQFEFLKDSAAPKFHEITVRDNGIGFDSKERSIIFEMFKRLKTKEKHPGTGIGLSICKKIMDYHNGHILAVGQKNVGATFKLYFPVEP